MIIFKDEDLNENWNLMELNDLLESQKAGCWGKESDEIDGTPVLRSTNYAKNFKLKLDNVAFREISKKDLENKKLEYMDILLEKSGGGPTQPVGRVILFDLIDDQEYVCGNFIQLLRVNKNIVDPKYLYYWLVLVHRKGFTNLLQNQTTGIRNLRLKDYLKLQVPHPPLKTQEKIVEILEKAEKLKEWRAESDELADEYLKSVFLEMFGDPVKNEKGWEITNFKEIASIDKKSIKAELINENSNYIGLEHLESGTGKILKISSAKIAGLKSNKYLFDDKCVLYGKLRPYLNKVALPNFKGVCSTDILPIIPIKDKSNKYFIKSLLSLDYYIKKATEQSTGANLPRISPKAIENFKVYSPPLDLQNQFADIVQHVEDLKSYQSESNQQIDNLFNTLMQKAFKGELVC